jgi:hypothetical protein
MIFFISFILHNSSPVSRRMVMGVTTHCPLYTSSVQVVWAQLSGQRTRSDLASTFSPSNLLHPRSDASKRKSKPWEFGTTSLKSLTPTLRRSYLGPKSLWGVWSLAGSALRASVAIITLASPDHANWRCYNRGTLKLRLKNVIKGKVFFLYSIKSNEINCRIALKQIVSIL